MHQTIYSGKNICTQLHLMTDLALNYRRYENLHEVRHNEYIDNKAIRRLYSLIERSLVSKCMLKKINIRHFRIQIVLIFNFFVRGNVVNVVTCIETFYNFNFLFFYCKFNDLCFFWLSGDLTKNYISTVEI